MSLPLLRGPLDGLFLRESSPPASISFLLQDSCLDRQVHAIYTLEGDHYRYRGTYDRPQKTQVVSPVAPVSYLRVCAPAGGNREQYRFWVPTKLAQQPQTKGW